MVVTEAVEVRSSYFGTASVHYQNVARIPVTEAVEAGHAPEPERAAAGAGAAAAERARAAVQAHAHAPVSTHLVYCTIGTNSTSYSF